MMTVPYERTRAIIQTETFLIELSKDKSIPNEKRQEARRLLRHYPSRKEVLLAGEIEEVLTSGTIFNPMLSSDEEAANTAILADSLIKHLAPHALAREDEALLFADEANMGVRRAAVELFGGDQTAADQWLHSEAMGLGWKRPIDVMQEDAQQVLDLITRIDRGVYT